MKTIKNAPFYLCIVGVFKEDWEFSSCFKFKKGDEVIIDQTGSRTPGYTSDKDVMVGRMGLQGFDCFNVPLEKLELKVKTIIPKFNIGDYFIHKNAGKQSMPSKISSYDYRMGSIWYQDEWGDKNNMASGLMEDNARLATDEECERVGVKVSRTYIKV